MSLAAALLLVTSAFTHAGWNLIGKKTESTIPAFIIASALGLVVLLPFPLLFGSIIPLFSRRVWVFLIITGAFQALYYASLSTSYGTGDMSVVYPIARSLPAAMVALIALLSGRGGSLSPLVVGGILLIVLGGLMLPIQSFGTISLSTYRSAALLFAFIAAIGTAGYSIIDDRALSDLRTITGSSLEVWQVTGVYAFFEGLSSVLWLCTVSLLLPSQRALLKGVLQNSAVPALIMGIGIYITYTIVLISMAFVDDVSYVVAFRQLSIPIGVVLSGVLLKEKTRPPRVIGAIAVFAGVVLVGIG